jgi:hypothetical protein
LAYLTSGIPEIPIKAILAQAGTSAGQLEYLSAHVESGLNGRGFGSGNLYNVRVRTRNLAFQ